MMVFDFEMDGASGSVESDFDVTAEATEASAGELDAIVRLL